MNILSVPILRHNKHSVWLGSHLIYKICPFLYEIHGNINLIPDMPCNDIMFFLNLISYIICLAVKWNRHYLSRCCIDKLVIGSIMVKPVIKLLVYKILLKVPHISKTICRILRLFSIEQHKCRH